MLKLGAVLGLVSDVNTVCTSIINLKSTRDRLTESRKNYNRNMADVKAGAEQRMAELNREHLKQMDALRQQRAAGNAIHERRMAALNKADEEREAISKQIDELMLKLKDNAYPDKEAILLELHKKNTIMHDISMSAINLF